MAGPIRRAVIPAAGLGARLLPATRAVPKAMLPVLDTPALQLAVAEAAAAGIRSVAIVVGPGDAASARHFAPDPELEEALRAAGRRDLAESVAAISDMAEIETIVQQRPLGLGHAVAEAAGWLGGEGACVLLPDDLIWARRPAIGEMAALCGRLGASVVAARRVPSGLAAGLGMLDAEPAGQRLHRVRAMVEKPAPGTAPSDLAIVGRYALTPAAIARLGRTAPGALGEVQLTDALAAMCGGEGVYAHEFEGEHVDAGTPLGMLRAAITEALARPDTAGAVRAMLRDLAAR